MEPLLPGAGKQEQDPALSNTTPRARTPSSTGPPSRTADGAAPPTYAAAAVPEASAAQREPLGAAPPGAALGGIPGRADLCCAAVIGLFPSLLPGGVICPSPAPGRAWAGGVRISAAGTAAVSTAASPPRWDPAAAPQGPPRTPERAQQRQDPQPGRFSLSWGPNTLCSLTPARTRH